MPSLFESALDVFVLKLLQKPDTSVSYNMFTVQIRNDVRVVPER